MTCVCYVCNSAKNAEQKVHCLEALKFLIFEGSGLRIKGVIHLLAMASEGGDNIMKIPVGKDDFDKIHRNDSYYVDKSELIYELQQGSGSERLTLSMAC